MTRAYADKRGLDPKSLTAAVAINAAVLAALFAANPEVVPTLFDPPIELFDPAKDPPPPEPTPPDTPIERMIETPATLPKTMDPIVNVPIERGPVIVTGENPVIDPTPLAGTGEGTIVDPPVAPPLPAPTVVRLDPRYLRDFQPDYPAAKQRREEEGRVTVRVLVGTNGRVKAIEPVGSADEAFFAATRRQALSRWRFIPATRGGETVESWHQLSVRFVLND